MKRLFLLSLLMMQVVHAPRAMELQGVLTQGGFAFGKVPSQTEVFLDGKAVAVASSGAFGIGFSRHHPIESTLTFVRAGASVKQTLIIEPRDFKVQHIQGVPKKTVNPNKTQNTRAADDRKGINAARATSMDADYFQDDFLMPTKGCQTGVFGSRRTYNGQERSWHKGLDLAAPTGTPIVAPVAGKVTFAADTFFNGNLVILDHGMHFFSLYAHMDKMAVSAGEMVTQGQALGTVGSTGRSTGPHLHWGFYWKKTALDPKLLLQSNQIENLACR